MTDEEVICQKCIKIITLTRDGSGLVVGVNCVRFGMDKVNAEQLNECTAFVER